MSRRTMAIVGVLALVLSGCGGSETTDDDGGDDTVTTTTAAQDSSPDESATTTSEAMEDSEPEPDSGGTVDGSDVDWATVDLTTIDWENLDMRTIDFQAISNNPTAADLTEETQQLIQSRIDPGSATLTIGDTTYEFASFLCAFGYESTESDRFVLSTSAMVNVDGTQLQLSMDIDDPSGQGNFTGPDADHRVTLDDISDFDNPSVSWVLHGTDIIEIDGYELSAAGTFTDSTGAQPDTEGTLTATCSTTSRDSR